MEQLQKYDWYQLTKQNIDTKLLELEKKLTGLVLTDEQSVINATNIGVSISSFEKEIETKRKEKVSPLNDEVKLINNFFKSYVDRVNNLKKDIASKIDAYRLAERRKAEEKARLEEERLKKEREIQRRKELAEAKLKNEEPPPIAPKIQEVKPVDFTPKTMRSDYGKATERITWKFEIVDLKKISREYLIPDETKIRKVINAGIREIPGIRIFEHRETIFSR
ncbi:MAG: hypothetical protein ACFFHD_15305 [Promethearchaeota archaeon]